MTKIEESKAQQYYLATQWQLMWRKFRKHKLAIVGAVILFIMYFIAIFCGFLSPHGPFQRYVGYMYCPPQKIRFIDEEGKFHIRPFMYGITQEIDMKSLRRYYTADTNKQYPIKLFIRSHTYKFWGLFETNVHLFGVEEPGVLFLLGTDKLGRDMLSRIFYASRISLSIGLLGVGVSFVLGCILGGISGFFGGAADMIIQRIIEFLLSIPTIPLWMALSASLPLEWSTVSCPISLPPCRTLA